MHFLDLFVIDFKFYNKMKSVTKILGIIINFKTVQKQKSLKINDLKAFCII